MEIKAQGLSREPGNFPGLQSRFETLFFAMPATFTAIAQQDGLWWIGWIEEVPGVNAQEKTKEKLLASLRVILREALAFNQADESAQCTNL